MKKSYVKALVTAAALLALIVVMVGAYTRLTNAGLGCPDWPGCYGHLVLPQNHAALTSAQEAYPQVPIESKKAWTEMVHRYAAGSLGIIIIFLALQAIKRYLLGKPKLYSPSLAIFLLCLLVFQALLGMWTVTLKLLPMVVMSHLLGGILIFSCLSVIALQVHSRPEEIEVKLSNRWRLAIAIGLIIVIMQIALGGWVSANYAGTACIGFPTCNGQWLPQLHLTQGFNLMSPVGENYQGGLLDSSARITIQFIHRLGAVITLIYISILSVIILQKMHSRKLRTLAGIALTLVVLQFMLGIINVVYLLPLINAVAHNGVAALLSAVMLMMFYLSGKLHHE